MSLSSSILPSKCLAFISLSSQDSHILISRASCILLFEVSSALFTTQYEIFTPSIDIHGFTIYGQDNIIIYGQECLQVITLVLTDNNISITPQYSVPLKVSGWILNIAHLPDNRILIATIHNKCIIIQNNNIESICCSVKCIVYSACFHGNTADTLLLGCGTVFNQVLLWKPLDTKLEPVRLIGHEGVIFSVHFNSSGNMLCSVSDDRTVRVWDINDYTLITTLYGHLSRIWDAKFIPNTSDNAVISAGEDATTRVWWIPSKVCTGVYSGHQGKCVCSLAVSSTGTLCAIASTDCSVRIINISSTINKCQSKINNKLMVMSLQLPDSNNKEKPSIIDVVDSYSYVVFSNRGTLYSVSIEKSSHAAKFTELNRDDRFLSYSVMKLSDYKNVLSLGSINGDYCLFEIGAGMDCKLVYDRKLMNSKILEIAWYQLTRDTLYSLVSGFSGLMKLIKVSNLIVSTEVTIVANLILPYSNHRWATCFVITEEWIICGDGKGSLHLYRVLTDASLANSSRIVQESAVPDCNYYYNSLFKLANVITSISVVGSEMLYVTARDGIIRAISIVSNKLCIVDSWHVYKDCDWIESIYFTDNNNNKYNSLIMITFHSQYLRLINPSEHRILAEIPCGGGHRSWGCNHFKDIATGNLSVGYIKSGKICIHQEEIVMPASHPLKSFMGHECNTAIVLRHHTKFNTSYIACGGEDGTLSIIKYTRHIPLEIISSHQRHISNIVSMGVWEYSIDYTILYTAGGRGIMKAWLISNYLLYSTLTHTYLTLLSEVSAKPVNSKKGAESELNIDFRIMSLASIPVSSLPVYGHYTTHCIVTTGSSDGALRVYSFSQSNGFTLLSIDSYHARCILSVRHLVLHSSLVLLSAATDGMLVIWNLNKLISYLKSSPLQNNVHNTDTNSINDSLLAFESSYMCHQSGINDFHIRQHDTDNTVIVCSVGDDNSISIICLRYDTLESPEGAVTKFSILWRLSEPYAHSSSIMSVYMNPPTLYNSNTYKLITIGRDQRVTEWILDQQTLLRHKDMLTKVTNVSGFILYTDNDGTLLLVLGLGIEVIQL